MEDVLSSPRKLAERTALAVLIGNAIGLLSGMQIYLGQTVEGLPANYTRIILRNELIWNIYAFEAVFVFLLCAWVRREQFSSRKRMAVWIAGAILFGFVDSGLYMPA